MTVTIAAPAAKRAHEWPAASVALVLDRSGSMDGQKIEMARTAVAHAIRLLNDRDRLSLIVYDDRVETVLECSPASKEAKTMALQRLARVHARGSTNLAAGWMAGAEQARRTACRWSRPPAGCA